MIGTTYFLVVSCFLLYTLTQTCVHVSIWSNDSFLKDMNTFASAFQKFMKNKMEWNVTAKIKQTTGRISSLSKTFDPKK
jgi:hypothetical protein